MAVDREFTTCSKVCLERIRGLAAIQDSAHVFDSQDFGLADKIHKRDPRDVRELDLDFL